jgi:hypothetical protein
MDVFIGIVGLVLGLWLRTLALVAKCALKALILKVAVVIHHGNDFQTCDCHPFAQVFVPRLCVIFQAQNNNADQSLICHYALRFMLQK